MFLVLLLHLLIVRGIVHNYFHIFLPGANALSLADKKYLMATCSARLATAALMKGRDKKGGRIRNTHLKRTMSTYSHKFKHTIGRSGIYLPLSYLVGSIHV